VRVSFVIGAAAVAALAACTAQAVPSATVNPASGAPSTSPAAMTASPSGPAFVTCREPNPNTKILAALEHVSGYAFSAAGFVYVADFTSDPNSPPKTRRARSDFEGAFVAPDRSWTRYRTTTTADEPEESIAIGRDLWIREGAGWERLADATDPAIANELASLVRDAGPGWESVAGAGAPSVPGNGCLFRIRVPVTSGGKGYREVAVRADPLTGLPNALRIVVKDALDPFGNRHDTDLLYRVRYDKVPAIEPPTQPSPSPS
jgi:hypothetical protein